MQLSLLTAALFSAFGNPAPMPVAAPTPVAAPAPMPDLSFFGPVGQTPIGTLGDQVVPGENPMTFCTSPENDLLQIERVDLEPNPPVPGSALTIKATGALAKDIEEGAKVWVQVKYGLIRLVSQEADLCEQVQNVDMQCPVEKGNMTLVKQVDLPEEIPPGQYTVFADAYTKDLERITCLEAAVAF